MDSRALGFMVGLNEAGVEFGHDRLPKAIRIFRAGANANSNYNPIIFDADAARTCIEDQTLRGNRFQIDFAHKLIDPAATVEDLASGGDFRLELRPDRDGGQELWAADIKWSDRGRKAVLSGEWSSVSPTWVPNGDHVVRITSLSLTSNPALYQAPQLRAASIKPEVRAADAATALSKLPRTASDDTILAALARVGLHDNAAKDALQTIARKASSANTRALCHRVLARIASREQMDRRMGLRRPAGVRHEGYKTHFAAMTADEAARKLAR